MDEEPSADYDSVKAAVLSAYELVPEAYPQCFRYLKKAPGMSHVEFARQKEISFDRWCRSAQVAYSFEKLREMVLLEEFRSLCRFTNSPGES